jgi:hypothetical protein
MIESLIDSDKRDEYLEYFCFGIDDPVEFRKALVYIVENKLSMFDDDYFRTKIDEDSNDLIIDLILPSFRRLWGKVYVDLPDILVNKVDVYTNVFSDRIKLYQALFNIDDFLDYFKEMVLKTKKCLIDFIYLDQALEHVTLISNNYIAYLLKTTNESDDVLGDTRDANLKKILK